MATEGKCAQDVFEIYKLTISMKILEDVVSHNHFETGYNEKHTLIKDQ